MARRFGIELEFQIDYYSQVRWDLRKRLPASWRTVLEDSIYRRHGLEVVSPSIRNVQSLGKGITVVNRYLKKHSKTIFTSLTGFHVHVEADDLSDAEVKSLVEEYLVVEHIFKAFFPKRKRNPHCISVSKMKDVHFFYNDIVKGYALRTETLGTKGTVEFRMAESTLSLKEISNWISLCRGFVNAIKRGERFNGHLDDLLSKCRLQANQKKFFKYKLKKLGVREP